MHKGRMESFSDGVIAGGDLKGKISLVAYVAAIPLAFARPMASCAIYVMMGLMWLVPDRRFERALAERRG